MLIDLFDPPKPPDPPEPSRVHIFMANEPRFKPQRRYDKHTEAQKKEIQRERMRRWRAKR